MRSTLFSLTPAGVLAALRAGRTRSAPPRTDKWFALPPLLSHIRSLMDMLPSLSWNELRSLAAVTIFLCTAARPDDVSKMCWPASLPTSGHITLHISDETKTRSGRASPLRYVIPHLPSHAINPALILRELYRCPAYTRSSYVISTDSGARLSSQRVSKIAKLFVQPVLDAPFQASFFRPVVSSVLYALGAPQEVILRVGKWKTFITFRDTYHTAGPVQGTPYHSCVASVGALAAPALCVLSVTPSTTPGFLQSSTGGPEA